MRPVLTHGVFNLAIDSLTCLWGGLIAPRLCGEQMTRSLEPFAHLISFQSTVGEDTHLSKENYFAICQSDNRTSEVGNNACCMVALFAYETLKVDAKFESIKNQVPVQFLYHLRNASAHGNRFNFFRDRNRTRFRDPGTVQWNKKTIDKALQDMPAFPDFFAAGDFAYLLEDVSQLM
jgi:hypothetical protein